MKFFLHTLGLLFFFVACGKASDGNSIEILPKDSTVINKNAEVEFWLTENQAKALAKQHSISFAPVSTSSSLTIVIDSTSLLQEMDGFGAALTGSSAYLIHNLSSAKRKDLLDSLFNPKTGIGINYLRLTIGSSDFSLGNYTYCDQPDISKFEIPAVDKRDLLPVLKEILEINPEITIMASPWSAPAWMKTSNSLNGGRLLTKYMDDYARYFVNYIRMMKQEEIKIDVISLQNEPQHETPEYPSMKMDWQQQNEFIQDHLGPLFKNNQIDTKIVILDHNWDLYAYPINILADTQTSEYIAGTAFHGYGGDVSAMTRVYLANPKKGIYFTEISGGTWSPDFNSNLAWNMKNIFIGGVNNYAKNVLMWNLALNDEAGPTNGGCKNCRGVVTLHNDGSLYRNVEYYSIGHFSKFINQGAYRVNNLTIGNKPDGLIYSTFLNSDKTKIAIVYNGSSSKQQFAIQCGNKKFISSLDIGNLATFKWK